MILGSLAGAISCAGDGPSGTTPVLPPAVISVGSEFDGTIQAGGTRELIFSALGGNVHRVFFQARSGSASDSLILSIRADSLGPAIGTLSSIGTQVDLASRVILVAPAPGETRYFLTVRGAAADDQGAFRVVVRGPGVEPEAAPAQLVVGDSVITESLDSESDVDRFVLQADSGAEYVVSLAMTSTRGTESVALELNDGLGSVVTSQAYWVALPWTAATLEQRSVRFRFSRNQSWLIIVSKLGAFGDYRPGPVVPGGYKLWVRRVNHAPEGRPAQLVVGDTINEAIDPVGDEDNYFFTAQEGDLIRVDAAIARPLSSPVSISVIGAQNAFAGDELRTPPARVDGTGWSFVANESGQFNLRLRGGLNALRDSLTTPYRVEVRRIDRTPEVAPDTISIGDTVRVESIERAGDIDEFIVRSAVDEVYSVRVTVGPDIDGQLYLAYGPVGDMGGGATLTTTNRTHLGRLVKSRPGALGIRLLSDGRSTGSYTIQLAPIDRAPEIVPSTLPISTWVSGETLVPSVDVDDFDFQLTAGRQYNVLIANDAGATGDPLARMRSPFDIFFTSPSRGGAIGSFTAPTTSIGRIVVTGEMSGSYRLMAYEVDSQPEIVASARAVGDSIIGETIGLPGDVDSFTLTGTAGDNIRLSIAADAVNPAKVFNVALYHPVTGELLLGVLPAFPASLVLPVTGTYRLAVVGVTTQSFEGTGAYRVRIDRLP